MALGRMSFVEESSLWSSTKIISFKYPKDNDQNVLCNFVIMAAVLKIVKKYLYLVQVFEIFEQKTFWNKFSFVVFKKTGNFKFSWL